MRLFRIIGFLVVTFGFLAGPYESIGAQATNKPMLKRVTGIFSADPAKIPGNMRFSEYTGFDASDWEISIGSLADTSYKLPVYRGWPSKPYVVVGDVRHQDPRKQWQEGEVKNAVRAAIAVGGDAIVIRYGSEAGVEAIAGMERKGRSYSQPQMTALVVRWQTETEIHARIQRDTRLLERLRATDSSLVSFLDPSEQSGALAIRYLLRTGVKDESEEFYPKLLSLARRIQRTNDGLSGEWLFRASLKSGGITSQAERSFMGIANVKVEGQDVAIISVQGETEANFSGQLTSGRMTGQLGVSSITAKAEGVAVARKISLSFQAMTQDGTASGTFVLQR